MKKKSKIISILLTLAFMAMLWPGAALAVGDTTPPEWADVPLVAGDRHPGCKRVSFIPYPKDETVTAYYIIVSHGDTPPTKEQVKGGSDYDSVDVLASGSQNDVRTNGYVINPYTMLPADDTIYDTYVVIEDAAGNASEPAMIELRTPVKLLADGYPKVGTPQAAGSKQVQILNQANGDSETTYWGGLADAYYVAVANGADEPSASQIKNGMDSTGSAALASGNVPIETANTEVPAVITLPADAAEYDIYVVLYKAYNASYIVDIWSEVLRVDVTTPLPALAAPTDLAWDDTTPGTIKAKWDTVPNALRYYVYLYKDGHICLETLETTNERNFISNLEVYGTGTYTFKVEAVGDGTNYGNSQKSAVSPGYNYTAAPDKIDIPAISGVTAPARGATPVTSIETDQYTGEVSWDPEITDKFAAETIYTATITLTPKAGYTLTGVPENFFTVEGATSVTNAADSGEVTAVFPATEEAAAVYAFDVLADSDVTRVYSIYDVNVFYTYPVCNGLLVYVEKESKTEAVEMSFTPGINGGGVYYVTLDLAYPGSGGSYLEFLFSEVPTVPSGISLTSGDAFTL
ncbi:MAG TPA: hypothetical protein P5273_10465, partial [Syntrophomonadaceae bacterium]|nr:hypothetical protein [Syntrophomonadaceae bacterium]